MSCGFKAHTDKICLTATRANDSFVRESRDRCDGIIRCLSTALPSRDTVMLRSLSSQ